MSGKSPDYNELLMIFVRIGRRSSHLLASVDGQDLRDTFWISCFTSQTDGIIKVGNDGTISSRTAGGVSSSGSESVCCSASSCVRIVSIF